MADTKWDFIISSNITNKSTSEIEHALMHLDDAKNKIDLTKTITTYDRFYNSIEIMFKNHAIRLLLHNTWKNTHI